MLGILMIMVGLIVVGYFIYRHAVSIHLPPKAQLICDLWKAVEHKGLPTKPDKVK